MMQKATREEERLKEFKVLRFLPNDIILLHKQTKKTYQYYESPTIIPDSKIPIQHSIIIKPLIIAGKGLLYPKPYKTLENEISCRKQASQPVPYAEEEIVNTFAPLI